ncbi:MAG: type I-MYXAN CRISPR-associated protein Cas6/Cmx6 [Gammaproteobacteria bacterium]|nr:MAG: type I-MYXAN CRISPR-associated protein Cas6/Cmx6 [Gammaproteobacteria bacterium]
MYWQEDKIPDQVDVPDDIIDLSFRIDCPVIPVDHSLMIFKAFSKHISWIRDAQGAGILPLPILHEGNGWYRSENAEDLLNLSKRTRLTLRIPLEKKKETEALAGKTLQMGEYAMTLSAPTTKPLSKETNIWSHYIVADPGKTEEEFLDSTIEKIRAMGIQPRKALCGRTHEIQSADGPLFTRSLLLADLDINESITLQQNGLGQHRHLGCGLFIPHKNVSAI